jgi:hypothetical protein
MTALGGGVPAAAVFVPAMIAGMWLFRALGRRVPALGDLLPLAPGDQSPPR